MKPLKRYSLAVMTELALSDQAVHGTYFAAERLKRRGVSFALAHRILLGAAPSTSLTASLTASSILSAVSGLGLARPIYAFVSSLAQQFMASVSIWPRASKCHTQGG